MNNIKKIWMFTIILFLIFTLFSCEIEDSLLNITILAGDNGTIHPAGTIEVRARVPLYISAIPHTGYRFGTWEISEGRGVSFGDQTAPYTTVTLTETDAVIRGNFVPYENTLTITSRGQGTTDPAGKITVTHGIPVAIHAIPAEDWTFDSWEVISGTGCSFGNIYEPVTTITLTAGDAGIQARFCDPQAPRGYTVEIDQPYIDENNVNSLSFTYKDAEPGATYYYYINDNAHNTIPIQGTGSIEQSEGMVTDINVTSLVDGILTLTFYIIDSSGNSGINVYDTVIKDTAAPSFMSVYHNGNDNLYKAGDRITIYVNMGEPGLTITADLSVLDAAFSTEQEFFDLHDNYYSFTTDPLSAITMYEGTDISITIEATDTIHTVADSFLTLTLDNTPPAGNFIIESSDDPAHSYSLSLSVTLALDITGAEEMRFGNSIPQRDAAPWEVYPGSAPKKLWTLSAGVAEKTVYGEFRDRAGNLYQTSDTIVLMKQLITSDSAINDQFGISVSVSSDGNVILGGARYDDDDGANSGSVYKFDDTHWSDEAKRTAGGAHGGANDYFGNSSALSADGTTIVAGAYGDDDNGSSSGSVYVFYGSNQGSLWKIHPNDPEADDYFGYSVAISADGNTIVAGAYGDDDKGDESGSVYVFTDSSVFWTNQMKLTATDGSTGDYFGYSVAVSADGTTIVAGAYNTNSAQGALYVYHNDGTEWDTGTKLTASDGAVNDSFGYSVAISGDGRTIVAGAKGDNSNRGAIYVFEYNGVTWDTGTKLVALNGEANDYFGYSVSVSFDGSIIAAGAYGDNDNGTFSGSAYVLSGLNWGVEIKHKAFDGGIVNYFGTSVALSSDGSTLVAGAHGYSSFAGALYVLPALVSMD